MTYYIISVVSKVFLEVLDELFNACFSEMKKNVEKKVKNVKNKTFITSHDSVSVVRTTFKVYGKRQTLTLSQPKTPEPIVTKFERRDYVVDPYHTEKIWAQSAQGFLLPM